MIISSLSLFAINGTTDLCDIGIKNQVHGVAGYDLFSQATLCGVKGIQRQGTTPLEQFKLSHDIFFFKSLPIAMIMHSASCFDE